MSSRRFGPSAYELQQKIRDQRGPNGRRLCTWCHEEVPKGRQSWCSKKCVDAYYESQGHHIRSRVWDRDRGICASCGIDTQALIRRFNKLRNWIKDRRRGAIAYNYWKICQAWLRKHGIPLGRMSSDWWDADHIVPVVEGGRNNMENLRTLCIPCHQLETRELRQRMKKPKDGCASKIASELEQIRKGMGKQ